MTKLTNNLIRAEHHITHARNYVEQQYWTSAAAEYERGLEIIADIIQELSDRCTAIEGENPHGELAEVAEHEIKTLRTKRN